MHGVLSAESAVFLHFETVGVILFVFHGVVVPLFALIASQGHFHAHSRHLLKIASLYHCAQKNLSGLLKWPAQLKTGIENPPEFTGRIILAQFEDAVKGEM